MIKTQVRASHDLGGVRISVLDGGSLRLDGGAMFGIIPKPLWSRRTPSDEQNRISLACNCVFAEFEGSDRRLMVETGVGPKMSDKEQAFFAVDPSLWLGATLQQLDIPRNSITDIALTHLHFDHAGGLTYGSPEDAAPTFPRAKVHVQKRELEDARANFAIMTRSYNEENFAPLDGCDAWRTLDGEQLIIPRVRALPSFGHTRGHQSILFEGKGRKALFIGDTLPTMAHIGAAYNMAFDLMPLENRDIKQKLLARAAEENWLLILPHEIATPVCEVRKDGDWFQLTPVA